MNNLKEKYVGKHLLVGLTYLNKDESIKERIQLHGIIKKISKSTIVLKRADNGEDFSVPFDEENLEPDPGGRWCRKCWNALGTSYRALPGRSSIVQFRTRG